jgi:hypothetical protein
MTRAADGFSAAALEVQAPVPGSSTLISPSSCGASRTCGGLSTRCWRQWPPRVRLLTEESIEGVGGGIITGEPALGKPVPTRQQSNTDQQMPFRKRWSSSTSWRIASGSWSRCHRHSRRRTEFVRGDVCDSRSLAGSVRGMPWCPAQVSGRGVCSASRRACLRHLDLASCPGSCQLDRMAWSIVSGALLLEKMQDVLGTIGSPESEQVMVRVP